MPKVLIVEDDIDLAETYADVLESMGLTVTIATSGTEAIRKLPVVLPHVVILDMQLPGASGDLVLAYIRRHPRMRNTKVLVVTGFPNMAEVAVNSWGADLSLSKPISVESLKKATQELQAIKPDDDEESHERTEPAQYSR